jgi:microcystin-dependent protein
MSTPYIGQLKPVGFNFAPVGYALCNGQSLAISEYEALFNLIGTTYGGNGQTTFNVPNLQSRIPIHQGQLAGGSTYVIGQLAGAETVTVGINQYPRHNHNLLASSGGTASSNPSNQTVGPGPNAYSPTAPASAMNPAMIGNNGGNLPHNNIQPYLVLNWIIALFGVYPTQG